MNPPSTPRHLAKLGLAFAGGVALSAGYVTLAAIAAPPPSVVVVEERCEQPRPTRTEREGVGQARGTLPAYGLDQAELEALARDCEVRDDVPEPLDDATAAALGLSADEREAYAQALAQVQDDHAAMGSYLLLDLAPEAALPTDDPIASRLLLHERLSATKVPADLSVHRHLAEERAGLRPPPTIETFKQASKWAYFERVRLNRGEGFATTLARVLDPARVDELRRVHQGWPGRRVRVSGCEDVPMPGTDPDQFSIVGELDPKFVERVIALHLSEIRACYELGLADDPELAGTLIVEFTINAEGHVSNAKTDDAPSLDPLIHRCVEQTVEGWRFAEPESGEVTVRYPFVLRPR